LDGGAAANRQSGTLGHASATARRESARCADWPTRAENITISLTDRFLASELESDNVSQQGQHKDRRPNDSAYADEPQLT